MLNHELSINHRQPIWGWFRKEISCQLSTLSTIMIHH